MYHLIYDVPFSVFSCNVSNLFLNSKTFLSLISLLLRRTENGFELTKKRSRRYPAKTITDADYADDIALLANTPNQAETLLHWPPYQCTQN